MFEQRVDADDALGVRGGDRRRGGRGDAVAAGDAVLGQQRHVKAQLAAWQRRPHVLLVVAVLVARRVVVGHYDHAVVTALCLAKANLLRSAPNHLREVA